MAEPTPLNLAILELLGRGRALALDELSAELGLEEEEARRALSELSKCFAISVSGSRVTWHPADNPGQFRPWGWMVHYRVLSGSTMVTARRLNPWSVAIAEYQLSGRGRFGKTWISALGGVWATLKVRASPRAASVASLAVPLAVLRAIERVAGAPMNMKWPNDVVHRGKKVAGVLLEAETMGEDVTLYIGVGVNVNNDPPLPTAASLKEVAGGLVHRNRLLSLLTGLASRLERAAEKPEEVGRAYLSKLETLGRRVVVELEGGTVEGVAEDVDELGRLVVGTGSGTVRVAPFEAKMVRYKD